MSVKQQVTQNSEVDERLAALMTNASAIRAVSQAVEGTIGPKGLDTMLVDQYGDVVITNDGVTILDLMEVSHPAARMLIKTAKAQQEEIGDGTTTAAIMAGALISEGVDRVLKGVPVVKVIEGIRAGIKKALAVLDEKTVKIQELEVPVLKDVALVAGRGYEDIASLVVQAASLIGKEKLLDPAFKLSEMVRAVPGAENQVITGVILDKEPLNVEMPKRLELARVLVIDDALEPEELDDEALGTEAGVKRYLQLQEEFRQNVKKLATLGVNLVLVDRGVHDIAEEILTDAGVLVLQRVANKELRQAAEHCGAKLLKRTALKKEGEELAKCLGEAREAYFDEKLKHVRLLGGKGKNQATILVGASTEEVVGERERIAKDAASAVQAAVRGGVLAGGGAVELAVAREVEEARKETRGMAAFGVECVIAALKKPFSQIVLNAGFNPLEKLGDVMTAQLESGKDSLGVDPESGEIRDMMEMGVYDPALVKKYALKAAGEVAEAILRIDTIIKKKPVKEKEESDREL
ncbi:MAG: TCP-1/cpn60 chaperonin family protein [Peptococcaceae bacterium]|jgi:chaperonin GroEL (HSP60 family)|nr:TCP-1/cpn60 chaperonin family protein [Peptococcaceae bacterium]MDH7524505.1 TCP-1/cpn60 chaperonin family protein [Peptococcaceae bacterium]